MKNNTKQFPLAPVNASAVADRAKSVVRRLTGSERAYQEVAHVGAQLQHVEAASQQQIQQLLAKVHEHEQRIVQLEKAQEMLSQIHAVADAILPNSVEYIRPGSEYFERPRRILEAVEAEIEFLGEPIAEATAYSADGFAPNVLEFFCGAAKSSQFLLNRDCQYLGLDPAEVLLRSAATQNLESRFAFAKQDSAAIERLRDNHFDAALALFEQANWSVAVAAQLITVAKRVLCPGGMLIICAPHSFAEMSRAGWDVQAECENNGFAIVSQFAVDGPQERASDYVIAACLQQADTDSPDAYSEVKA